MLNIYQYYRIQITTLVDSSTGWCGDMLYNYSTFKNIVEVTYKDARMCLLPWERK